MRVANGKQPLHAGLSGAFGVAGTNKQTRLNLETRVVTSLKSFGKRIRIIQFK